MRRIRDLIRGLQPEKTHAYARLEAVLAKENVMLAKLRAAMHKLSVRDEEPTKPWKKWHDKVDLDSDLVPT